MPTDHHDSLGSFQKHERVGCVCCMYVPLFSTDPVINSDSMLVKTGYNFLSSLSVGVRQQLPSLHNFIPLQGQCRCMYVNVYIGRLVNVLLTCTCKCVPFIDFNITFSFLFSISCPLIDKMLELIGRIQVIQWLAVSHRRQD